MTRLRLLCPIALAGALLLAAALPAGAAETVHVGKAVGEAWTFLPLDVGVREGFFARHGLDVDIVNFMGDAKMQQGLAADSIQLGVGSGPSMAFAAKGAPAIAVATFAGAPYSIAIIVGADSPIKTVSDLKGKTVSVSTAGSLTAWLVQRVSLAQGWGPDGIKMAALGGFQPSVAALRTHEIDAMMSSPEGGYVLEEKEVGRILVDMDRYAPVFITHVVFAQKQLVASDPDLVKRFLEGFFAAIAFMKSHPDETSKIAEAVLQFSPAVANKIYRREIAELTDDGTFDPKAVAVLKRSFVEMGILTTEPSDDQLFTTRFVPVKPVTAAR